MHEFNWNSYCKGLLVLNHTLIKSYNIMLVICINVQHRATNN